jgi:trimeric autotransporter adhesin
MRISKQTTTGLLLKGMGCLLLFFALNQELMPQGIAINESGIPRDASSLLDVSSTAKGILVPRMTQAQRNAIPNPATGLIIYQTNNTPGFYYNGGTPTVKDWKIIGNNAGVFSQWATNGSHIYYNSGNVGIGTSSPAFKLTVVGDALINGVRVGYGGGLETSLGNTAFGQSALNLNTTGSYNTALGTSALSINNNGDYNTSIGSYTMTNNYDGHRNTAVGVSALSWNLSGYSNTGLGYNSLLNCFAGWQNTSVGDNSNVTTTYGSYNSSLGYNTGPNASNLHNVTCLGIDATGTANDQVRVGNTFVQSIGGYKDWTNISDDRFKVEVKEDVPGLEFIKMLRPVSYRIDREKINDATGVTERREKIRAENPDVEFLTGEAFSEITTGLIAQEVEAAARQLGYDFSGVDAPRNENDLYGLRYATFVVPIIKAIQEQQHQIEGLSPAGFETLETELGVLRHENERMRAELDEMRAILSRLSETMQQCCSQLRADENSSGSDRQLHTDTPVLEQNMPNPFNEHTLIRYYLPVNSGEAHIIVTDMLGIRVRSFEINAKGQGQMIISSESLPPGTYVYSLMVNNRVVDSKRMVLL